MIRIARVVFFPFVILWAVLTGACDVPNLPASSTPLACGGPDGTTGCPCRHPSPPCSDPGNVCSAADVCVPADPFGP
jgi:hypothetical protein